MVGEEGCDDESVVAAGLELEVDDEDESVVVAGLELEVDDCCDVVSAGVGLTTTWVGASAVLC